MRYWVGAHQNDAFLFAYIYKTFALFFCIAKGLFHQDMFFVARKEDAAFIVKVMRQRYQDGIDHIDHFSPICGDKRIVEDGGDFC